MKFELVGFYPKDPKAKLVVQNKNIGTVHIYCIDCELDLRGISVIAMKKGLFFHIPHYKTTDEEGKFVRYPIFRFTKQETHTEMMNFLHNTVKPIILKSLNSKSK